MIHLKTIATTIKKRKMNFKVRDMRKRIFMTVVAVFIGGVSFAQATATDFITTGLNSPEGLLIANDTLYIADNASGNLFKVDLTADTPIPTIKIGGLTDFPGGVFSFALNGNDLYIAQLSGNRVVKINITDTNPTLVPVVSGMQFPFALELKGDDLYISESSGGKISKIDITASTPTTAVDFVTGLTSPRGLLLNGNDLYVIEEGTADKISKINLTTKVVEDVLTGLGDPSFMVLHGNDLYFSENSVGKVSKIDISSGTTPTKTEVLTGLDSPRGLAIHNNILYISEDAGDTDKILTLALTRSGSLMLSTQTDIDNLTSANFAGIEDDLTINDTTDGNITSLTGLSNIVSVGGNLQILNNTALTSLEGLGRLATLGGQLQIGTITGEDDSLMPNAALIDFCAISQLVTGTPPQVVVGKYFIANNGYNPSYAGLASGTVESVAGENDGCSEFGTAVVSTNTFSKEEGYRLFPNPVTDVLFVKSESKITSITISNVSGQEVLKGKREKLNVQNLSKGIYFARIVSGEKTVVEKFVKF